MKGFSPRNLKYMRAFAAAWPDRELVQQTAAQVPWFHNCLLLDRVSDPATRQWYIQTARREGWSRNVLGIQIQGQAHLRQGPAQTNFPVTLPTADSDMAVQIFKDPYLFDFLGTDAPRREAEYALAGSTQPISVAEWETQLTRALPQELEGSLPTIEQIEAELSGDIGGGDE